MDIETLLYTLFFLILAFVSALLVRHVIIMGNKAISIATDRSGKWVEFERFASFIFGLVFFLSASVISVLVFAFLAMAIKVGSALF